MIPSTAASNDADAGGPSMRVLGIDFTSRPRPRKPITCLHCVLEGDLLRAQSLEEWPVFEGFEQALRRPGPWIAGIDFPFGQARRFVETIGWPLSWEAYVQHAHELGRSGYRQVLDAYRAGRADGDKEHRRRTDIAAGSISPQKLYGVPVGLMFFEGAPRLVAAGVRVPHLQDGDPARIVVEAYPGVLARGLLGRRSYKHDSVRKQSADHLAARQELLGSIAGGALRDDFGFHVQAESALCNDPAGDHLDALLCAIQAAWAWRTRAEGFGAPSDLDPLEGWIADPSLRHRRRSPVT
jgi:hypothetical protein